MIAFYGTFYTFNSHFSQFIHNHFSNAEHMKFVFTYKYLFKLKAL